MSNLQELMKKKLRFIEEGKSLDRVERPKTRWWPEKDGEYEVRIVVPPVEVAPDPFFERYKHRFAPGFRYGMLCPLKNKVHDNCAVCEKSFELYKAASDDDEKAAARKLMTGQTYFSLVLVRGLEKHGLLWWEYNWNIYNDLVKNWLGKHWNNFTDPENGFDIEIRKEKTNKMWQGKEVYDVKLSFIPGRKPVMEDMEKFEEMLANAPTWVDSQWIPEPSDVRSKMNDFLFGGTDTDASGSDESDLDSSEDDDAPSGKKLSAVEAAFQEFKKG